MAIDNVRVFSPNPDEVALVSFNLQSAEYTTLDAFPLQATIRNMGGNPLSSVQLSHSLNGGASVSTLITLAPPLVYGQNRTLSHPVPINFIQAGTQNIAMEVSLPNGVEDPTPEDNVLSTSLVALTTVCEKKMAFELYTSNTGGYCPWAHHYLAQVVEQNDDVIPVSVHGEMAGPGELDIPDGAQAMEAMSMNAFPQLTVNRYKMPWPWITGLSVETEGGGYSTYIWNEGVALNRSVLSPAAVYISEQSFDPETRQFLITVQGEFFAPMTDDFRFNVYLVENNVTGTGAGYDQTNYMNTLPNTPFTGLGNPIVDVHKHVLRAKLGGPWGTPQSLPATVVPGTVCERTYTFIVPDSWNADNLAAVALIQRFDSEAQKCPILNAESNAVGNGVWPPSLTLSPAQATLECGQSASLSAQYTGPGAEIVWMGPSGVVGTGPNVVVSPAQTTVYTVTAGTLSATATVVVPFVPQNLFVGNLGTNSATVSWSSVPGAASYRLRYRPTSSLFWTNVSTGATAVTLFNLQTNTQYVVQVAAMCGGVLSPWSPLAAFTTLSASASECTTAANFLAQTGPGSGSVLSTWDPVAAADRYQVQYRRAGTMFWTTATVLAPSSAHLATGLSVGQSYEFRIRVICGTLNMPWQATQTMFLGRYATPNDDTRGLSLYPNPNSGAFTLRFSAPEGTARATVYDAAGRAVRQTHFETAPGTLTYDWNADLPSGLYFLRLSTANGVYGAKLTVR